jgi:hypothetical protein
MSNVPRNRSLRFEDHAGIMNKLAKMFFARMMAAQIHSATYDEIMGELSLAFVKAAKGYNPDAGFTFTAFLERCCLNHCNKWASKLIKEQYGSDRAIDFHEAALGHMGLGYVSVHDMETEDGEDPDFYSSIEDDTFARPDDVADAAMTLKSIIGDATLLPETRVYVALLANPHTQVSEEVRNRIRRNAAKVREQVTKRWGVELPFVRV